MDRYDAIAIGTLLCLLVVALLAGYEHWWVFGVAAVLATAVEAWRRGGGGRSRSRSP